MINDIALLLSGPSVGSLIGVYAKPLLDKRQFKRRRPEMNYLEDPERKLKLEYHNAMIFASDKVLVSLRIFLQDKTMANYEAVARAMRKDLYL